jgi:histone deacetylase complex regulatory component SIN3
VTISFSGRTLFNGVNIQHYTEVDRNVYSKNAKKIYTKDRIAAVQIKKLLLFFVGDPF